VAHRTQVCSSKVKVTIRGQRSKKLHLVWRDFEITGYKHSFLEELMYGSSDQGM